MKTWSQPFTRWLILGVIVLAPASVLFLFLSQTLPFFILFTILFTALNLICMIESSKNLAKSQDSPVNPSPRGYRPRDTGAGRWLDAPVAELDKSTIGKLLASRASRDPGLHVVVRRDHPPACTDVLYDPELDG